MASEKTSINDEEAGRQSEHDYAHYTAGNLISTNASDKAVPMQENFTPAAERVQSTLLVELPEPSMGAEVDCPGGANGVETSRPPQAEEYPLKSEAAIEQTVGSITIRGGRRRHRPEDKNCSACRSKFERQGRSFNRRAVYTFTNPETVQWAFPDATVHDKSFLCEICAQVIRSKCKRKQSGKRTLWLKPARTKQSGARDKKKKDCRMGKKSKAAQLVSKSRYKAAFKMLWSAKGARKPMMEFWSKQLKKEMKVLSRHTDSPFHQKVSNRKPLSSFPWRRCLNWAQDKAPLVTTCLTSLFPDINSLYKSSLQMSEDQAQKLLMRRAVVALSIPLFTRNSWRNNFLQAALGAELRLQGCSGSALSALNTMGLCQNKDTVRLLINRLRNGKTMPTQNGRQRMKFKLEQMQGDQMTDVEEEDIKEEEEVEEEDDEDEEEDEEEEEEDEEDEEDEEMEDSDEEEEEEDDEEMEMEIEEVVGEEEVQDGVQEEDEEDQAVEEKKRRKKAAKTQRKDRGELDDEDGESEQKKRRVVVLRLDLLKGHSEVGRSDLSAP